ncbi:MAG: hypothetical protein KDK36_10420 [Leptospiraceae bacterium]|nr:hypothetical protein [Leptospiraceae bacterium]
MKIILILILQLILFKEIIGSEIVESDEPIEDLNLRIVELLNNITSNSVQQESKTSGFNYRYKPYFFSPFRFDVYIGKFSKKSEESIVRVEAPRRGEARVLRDIIEQTITPDKPWIAPAVPVQSKSHIAYQATNLISPSLGIIYSGYKSPFYDKGEMIMKSALYLLIDLAIVGAVAIYAQNTKSSKSTEDKLLLKPGPNDLDLIRGKNAGLLIGLLMIPRAYRAIDGAYEIGTQNRIAELGYTIHF